MTTEIIEKFTDAENGLGATVGKVVNSHIFVSFRDLEADTLVYAVQFPFAKFTEQEAIAKAKKQALGFVTGKVSA